MILTFELNQHSRVVTDSLAVTNPAHISDLSHRNHRHPSTVGQGRSHDLAHLKAILYELIICIYLRLIVSKCNGVVFILFMFHFYAYFGCHMCKN